MNKLNLFLFTAIVLFISGCQRNVKIDGIYVDFAKIETVKNGNELKNSWWK